MRPLLKHLLLPVRKKGNGFHCCATQPPLHVPGQLKVSALLAFASCMRAMRSASVVCDGMP